MNDEVEMVAFMASLGKKKNQALLRSLYLNPQKKFDSTLARATNYMLANEALNSSKEEHDGR